MKIGILTQPLKSNYGGILQNYALQLVLKRFGHNVWTINRIRSKSFLKRNLSIIKRIIFFKKPVRVWTTDKEEQILYKNMMSFIDKNISTTEQFSSFKQISKIVNKYDFDAYIVGSDQCWRPEYNDNNASFFFLDFLNYCVDVKRIAYAASFGVDRWTLSNKQTNRCAHLAKRFNALSTREDSGVTLCKDNLGVDAVQVLDPTLLLEKEDYISLIKESSLKINPNGRYLVTYVLDNSQVKNNIAIKLSHHFNLEINNLMNKYLYSRNKKNDSIEDYILMPIEDWIAGFYSADFVLTDSFHGTIFSIIFNKQFITIGNNERGMARFKSLLKLFGLEDRLIFSIEDLTEELTQKIIDYNSVNAILLNEREKALQYLSSSLK